MSKIRFNIFTSIGTMYIAWFMSYLLHAYYQVHYTAWGIVNDFMFIYFWTGLFALITSVIFVRIIISVANKTRRPQLFLCFFSTLAGPISMFLLLLPITGLQSWRLGAHFYIYSAVIGLIFGLIYDQLHWTSKTRLRQFWTVIFAIAFQIFVFYVLPYSASSIAYQYFGDTIRIRAVENVLMETQVGDSIHDLNRSLPNFISTPISSAQGWKSGTNDFIEYKIEYKDFKITKLDITKR